MGVIILVLSGCLLYNCNTGAFPPVDDHLLVGEPFIEQKKGYTIRYPQGWMYRWEDHGDAARFFKGGQADQINPLPGPTVIIVVGPIEAFEEARNTTDPQVILKSFLDGQSLNLNSKAGKREGSVEKIVPVTVGGKDAAIATLKGSENGINFTAQFVFVHTGDRGAFIFAVGQNEEWEIFNPTFDAMLATMTFIEPSAQ